MEGKVVLLEDILFQQSDNRKCLTSKYIIKTTIPEHMISECSSQDILFIYDTLAKLVLSKSELEGMRDAADLGVI
jgi:hypothetical protein